MLDMKNFTRAIWLPLLVTLVLFGGAVACNQDSDDDTNEEGGTAYWTGPTTWEPEDVAGLERVTQQLVAPPFLPAHEAGQHGRPQGGAGDNGG